MREGGAAPQENTMLSFKEFGGNIYNRNNKL